MKLHDKLRAKATIRKTARKFEITPAQSRADMQAAIDDAWERTREDPAARAYWEKMFPGGRKPSLEEFICRVAKEVEYRQGTDRC